MTKNLNTSAEIIEDVVCFIRWGTIPSALSALDKLPNDAVDQFNDDGNPLSFIAAWHGAQSVLEELVKKGADLTVRNEFGNNILNSGARHSAILELILENESTHAFINEFNSFGVSPLMVATDIRKEDDNAYEGFVIDHGLVPDRIKAVDLLIKMGADLDLQNKHARTVLMYVVNSYSKVLLEHVLSYNPNPLIRDLNDNLAIDIAEEEDFKRIIASHNFKSK